jgi:hypothetical protein
MQHIPNVTKPRTVLRRKGIYAAFPSFGVARQKKSILYTTFFSLTAKPLRRQKNLYISTFFSLPLCTAAQCA